MIPHILIKSFAGMVTPLLSIKKLHPQAIIPTRGSAEAAGLDLYSIETLDLSAGARYVVKTGIAMSLSPGYYGRVAPRSGLAVKFGIDVGAGVIDSDYRGEVGVLLFNLGTESFRVEAGMRIAQLIVEPVAIVQPMEVEVLDDTQRGSGGFGSTG